MADSQYAIWHVLVHDAGFSRAGYATYYAITHPGRTPLAAAVCDDANDGSYVRYVIAGGDWDALSKDVEAHVGASFWRNKSAWLDAETTFNADQIRTPALFTRKNSSLNGLLCPSQLPRSTALRPHTATLPRGCAVGRSAHAPRVPLATINHSCRRRSRCDVV